MLSRHNRSSYDRDLRRYHSLRFLFLPHWSNQHRRQSPLNIQSLHSISYFIPNREDTGSDSISSIAGLRKESYIEFTDYTLGIHQILSVTQNLPLRPFTSVFLSSPIVALIHTIITNDTNIKPEKFQEPLMSSKATQLLNVADTRTSCNLSCGPVL